MCDRLNVAPHDQVMLDEIELVTNLVIAATEIQSTGPMPQQLIDRILGIPVQRQPAAQESPGADTITDDDTTGHSR